MIDQLKYDKIKGYVRENGQGHLRLWCELDESFDCYHIGYALTLAPVQEMFVRVRGGK